MTAPIKEYTIPTETLAVFNSTMIVRKKRMSLLVEWFMQNWWQWTPDDMLPNPTPEASVTNFAMGLTSALTEYNITINKQRVWTWLVQRNLPRSDNFEVMSKIATGWQREFALLVLDILASQDPISPD